LYRSGFLWRIAYIKPGMKKFRIPVYFIVLLTSTLISCKKLNETAGTSGTEIIGRWRLVSDSTYSSFQTTGPAIISTNNYNGAAGDYYDFKTGGQLSIRRGSFSTDTASYSLEANNKINILLTPHPCTGNCIYFANDGAGVFDITTLTAYRLVLSSKLLSPEGPFEEIMTFKR